MWVARRAWVWPFSMQPSQPKLRRQHTVCMLTRIIHKLIGRDKETAIWWAGACELTFHFDDIRIAAGISRKSDV